MDLAEKRTHLLANVSEKLLWKGRNLGLLLALQHDTGPVESETNFLF